MNTLKLRKELFPAIYSEKKTCTSRQGIRNFTLYDKLTFVATEDNSIHTDVIITNVKYCKFDELTKELAVKGENDFVKEVYKHNMKSLDILNWYRNLYYKEGNDTERGVMAMAINDLFMTMSKGL